MSLRMVEFVVPDVEAAEASALSKELSVIGLWREQLDENRSLLRMLVPSSRTERLIHELESRFGSSPGFRLFILEVQATIPKPEPDEPEDGAANETDDKQTKDPARIACAELVQKISTSAKADRIYVATVTLSTIVAAVGLVRNDVAVIIGAMVIAPLLGPNMALALATTLGDPKLARQALRVNLVGVAIAFALSVIIGLIIPIDPSVSQIHARTNVSLSDLALALAAGSAGALAFTTGLSAALVGVMVAVALLPPLATLGLLLGAGYPRLALGALLLTATNVVCINIAAIGAFLWQRITPGKWWEAERARRMVRIAGAAWFVLLALMIALILLALR